MLNDLREVVAERDSLQSEVKVLREALVKARAMLAEIDEYQQRPERGDWGVECACCMGEMFDGSDRAALAEIDAALSHTGDDR
jgi:hypothetical protein